MSISATIACAVTRLFVEQLSVIDCAYLDAERGLVGESWIVDLELDGDLDTQSMVLDFGEVKRGLKQVLDASADHTLLVPRRSNRLAMHDEGDSLALLFDSDRGGIEHRSPRHAVTLVDAESVHAETLAAHLHPLLQARLPDNVHGLCLSLRTEPVDGAYYHYVHGLKKHHGHCQRIAHGHRSRLEIRVDGERARALEREWAQRWRDVYLVTREDVKWQAYERIHTAYEAPEGRFELELPETHCDFLDDDSTVERIAAHIARRCEALHPGLPIEVRAYEGVNKGAIAARP
jgi:6-pyruvoyl-tetrahydropterin synthase